ncbi:MAG: methyltransferase type 11 [Candidatus Altiarchaeales archaeon WOR_SM1_86-2]|nr:MAG: methyltransferase type 11 [Candidatus Altiarchaeales archaeon WOR_SM1_86-2]ODS37730.1 MAG: methyltransferase type 11 [Candidatus Altiarchaeales archaeon WOR_SM1_79]
MESRDLFDGKKYEGSSQHQRKWGNKLIDELELEGSEKILDLGCGNGLTTRELAKRVPGGRVIGVDWSSSMLETAETHKTGNMELILLDINEMAFDREFDLVFSSAMLHWIPDHERLLGNIYSALKPGGFMRVQFGRDGNCSNFFAVAREVMKTRDFEGHFRGFVWPWYMPKLEEYEKLLSKTKFKNCRVWGENADHYFPDEESMINWIEQPSIIPLIAALPKNLRASFRDEVVERMVKRTKKADGRYFETFRRINVYAEK